MGKTPEDSRGLSIEAEPGTLPCAAGQPHCQASRPMGPPCQSPVAMSVLHRLKNHIYAILLSQFDPRVHDASRALYIPACTPLQGSPRI
jgi:hypothetical protein